MSRYFISATDYGRDNDKYPRYRVYTWNSRREPWGHIGNHPISPYFWTNEEAHAEAERLESLDDKETLNASLLLLVGLLLIIYVLYRYDTDFRYVFSLWGK